MFNITCSASTINGTVTVTGPGTQGTGGVGSSSVLLQKRMSKRVAITPSVTGFITTRMSMTFESSGGISADEAWANYQQFVTSGQLEAKTGLQVEDFTRLTPHSYWAPPALPPAVGSLSDGSIAGIVAGSVIAGIIFVGLVVTGTVIYLKKKVDSDDSSYDSKSEGSQIPLEKSDKKSAVGEIELNNMLFYNHRGSIVQPLPTDQYRINARNPPDLTVVQVARLPTGRIVATDDKL